MSPPLPNRPTVKVNTFSQAPSIDGDISEWETLPAIAIDQEDQCNRFPGNPLSRNWAGPEDSSARIWFGASTSDFLIAGEVRDDSHVDPVDPWWHGDAVELFLCLRPGDGERGTFDEDDYQIFLMPLRREGRWGAWIQGGLIGPGDSSFYGVRVEGKPRGQGYTFEAALPWANFPSFDPQTREIAANIAIDDADGAPGFPKNYLVWTRDIEVYRDASRMARLSLPESAWKGRDQGQGGGALFQEALFVVAGLLGIGLLFGFAKRAYRRFGSTGAFPRWAGIFTLGVLLSLLATAALRRAVERRAMGEMEPAVESVKDVLREIARGAIGPAGQPEFEEDLTALFAGKPVTPKVSTRYAILPVGDPAPRAMTEESEIPFFRFDRPLVASAPMLFECSPPRATSAFALALELESSALSDWTASGRQPLALQVVLHHPAGNPTRAEFSLEQARKDRWKGGSGPTFATSPVFVWTLPLESVPELSRIQVLASGSDLASLRFSGISLREGASWVATPLGFLSETGVPAPVGQQPAADAGIRFAPGSGQTHDIVFPPDTQADQVSLLAILEADEPSTGRDYGAPLLEVRAKRRDTGEEAVFTLRRDIDLHPWNLDRSPHLPDMESRAAFRWEERGVRRHLDLCELRLPSRGPWEKLKLIERGGGAGLRSFPVRVLGVTAGISLPPSPIPADATRLLALTQDGAVQMASAELARFQGLQFSFVRPGERIQDEGVFARGESRAFFLERPNEESVAGALLPVREGERIVGALEIARPDPDADSWRKIVGLLPLFTASLLLPFLILSAASALGALGRLRSQLLGAFLMTSVLPLLLLLVFLSDLLLGRYRSAEEESLRAALAAAEQKVIGKKSQVSQASYAFAQAFLDHPRIRDLLSRPDRPDYEASLRAEIARMRPSILSAQRGFLHFQEIDASTQGIRRIAISEGISSEELRRFPFAEASFFEALGKLRVAGVHRVQEGGRRFVFVAGEIVEPEPPVGFLGRMYSPSGYPLEGAGLEDAERALSSVAKIRAIALASEEKGEPAGESVWLGAGAAEKGKEAGKLAECQIALRPIRGADGIPVSYLGLAKPQSEYLIQFGITEIPLRRGLILFGGLVLISAFVVVRTLTARLTRPIERLEKGARSLRGGEIPLPVLKETQDEIGALTDSFNEMSDALRRRFHELSSLNQGLRDMSSCLEPEAIAAEASNFLRRSLKAERLLMLLPGQGGAAAELLSEEGNAQSIEESSPELRELLDATELRVLAKSESHLAFLPSSAFVLAAPLKARGGKLGCLIVGLADAPDGAQREFLLAAAGQVAIAFENARLFRLAIEDSTTGAYNGTYFRSRLADEIVSARDRGASLSLLRISLKELEISLQRGRTPQADAVLEWVGGVLRSVAPRGSSLGRAGLGDFHLALPDVPKEQALRIAADLRRRLSEPAIVRGRSERLSLRPKIAVAAFPEDGQSPDFLLYALDPGQAVGRRAASGVYDVRDRADSVRVETSSGEAIFRSPRMLEILGIVERIAASELPVLLQGETGVGKEIVADLVQQQSARADKPYVKINCAAIPEGLLESELFGVEKGAFTGASERRIGRFEMAHQGTVFLDEVGELPLPVQAKLLRVLQEKKVTRLGGSEPVEADFRIVAATNRDLFLAVTQGTFRSDLFYRLQGISLVLPPLRERREEISDLVELARQRFCEREKREVKVSTATLDLFFRYDWPGNVRELLHVMEKGLLLSEMGVLDPAVVAEDLKHMARVAEVRATEPKPPAERIVEIPPSIPTQSLNERQVKLVRHLVNAEVITTVQYVGLASVSRRTALRDLDELVQKGILKRTGKRRAAQYGLPKNLAKLSDIKT